MDRLLCKECRRVTTVVHDHAAGDMICQECGLVVESQVIDETSEWRTFSNEASNNDPVRVGGPTDSLLSGAGLSTVMMGGRGEGEVGGKRGWSSSASNPDRDLSVAFQALDAMAERLELFDNIKGAAREIFAKYHEGSNIRGRTTEGTYAGCIYIACRKLDKPRTFKEIASACVTATKKEIGRATKMIARRLEDDMGAVGAVKPEVFMPRFCSRLRLEKKLVDAAVDIVKNCENIDLRTSRAHISKASAAIYMVTQLKGANIPCQDIAGATGVAETTIRNTYKDLLPFANRLIPEGFATKEEIDRLPNS